MKTIDVGPSDKFEPATKTPRELRNGGLRGSKVSKASSWSLVMITPYGIRNTEQLRSTFVTIDLQRFFKPVSSGTKCGYQLWFQWLWAGLLLDLLVSQRFDMCPRKEDTPPCSAPDTQFQGIATGIVPHSFIVPSMPYGEGHAKYVAIPEYACGTRVVTPYLGFGFDLGRLAKKKIPPEIPQGHPRVPDRGLPCIEPSKIRRTICIIWCLRRRNPMLSNHRQRLEKPTCRV
ncbi:uncharacterized protein CIMG_10655 [Coccidioides immitis RS]|uniref:Uncharacterized protein n=1 Tax=Coccidioides immitis (strain RS) TaxID=246410 RepID=A0A0D8JTF1_COCIM|nr:uncharacterized protein CIMG_10655 [Coccidioides immitis RS]KJF60231.1 hypothetical protein CIMG_10655 [Coccidioides immitis RS]